MKGDKKVKTGKKENAYLLAASTNARSVRSTDNVAGNDIDGDAAAAVGDGGVATSRDKCARN
jgi:hypothetical protein